MRPDLGISSVPTRVTLPPTLPPACQSFRPATMRPDVAMMLSMSVEITSLMPRLTFSTPATPLYVAPTVMPTSKITATWSGAGRSMMPPTWAATNAASRYCPSTPMLNSLMRKPIAAAMPEMNNGVALLRMSTIVSSLLAWLIMSPYASSGLLPAINSTIDEAAMANTSAMRGAAEPSARRRSSWVHAGALLQRSTGHVRPEVAGCHGGGIEGGHQSAAKHDHDGVGQPDQFVEVGADQQCGQTGSACCPELVPHCGLGADIDTTGRMRRDQHRRVGAHLAPDDQLLLVAARQCVGGHVDVGSANVERVADVFGGVAHSFAVHPEAARERLLRLVAERGVLPERRRQQQTFTLAILWDVAEPVLAATPYRGVRDVLAEHGDRARLHLPCSDDCIDQLRLSVALDAGDADHLAAVHGEADVADDSTIDLFDDDAVDLQHDVVGDRRLGGGRCRQLGSRPSARPGRAL